MLKNTLVFEKKMVLKTKLLKNALSLLLVFVVTTLFFNQNFLQLNNTRDYFIDQSLSLSTHENKAEISSLLNSSSTWGDPTRITTEDIEREGYVIAEDKNGFYHCIWLGKITTSGLALYHNILSNDLSNNWSKKTLIARLEAEITNLKLVFDGNNTLHLFFVAERENIHRIYYCSKLENSLDWNDLQIITTNYNKKITDLSPLIINDFTLHLTWVYAPIMTTMENHSLVFASFENGKLQTNTLIISEEKIAAASRTINQTALEVIYSFETATQQSKLFQKITNDSGSHWITNELYQFNIISKKINIYATSDSNETHILWQSKDLELFYLKLLNNGSINNGPDLIGNPNSDVYSGGIINTLTNSFYLFYEERLNTRSDIYFKFWNNTIENWETTKRITNNWISINPIAIENEINNNTLGIITYIGKNSLNSFFIDFQGNLSQEILVQKTTYFNYSPTLCSDSNGTIHLLWTQTYQGTHEIFYTTKELTDDWVFVKSLTIENWSTATYPSMIIDENDTLHCVFVAKYKSTNFDALYYTYLSPGSNWSNPIAVKIPEDDAEKTQAEILIDNEGILHILWTEQAGFLRNNIIYSTKNIDDGNFTSTTVYENAEGVTSFDLSAVVDDEENIHLVFADFIGEPWSSKLHYIHQFEDKTWSQSTILDASSVDFFEKPILEKTLTGKLSLVYLRKYLIASQKIAADIRYRTKEPGGNWIRSPDIINYELITSLNYFILPNGKQCIIYHSRFLSIGGPGPVNDYCYLVSKEQEGNWGEKELIFLNPNYEAKPMGTYNPITTNMFFIIIDKNKDQPQLNWLTAQKDSDQDKLGDLDEKIYRTNSLLNDTDNDGVFDGDEVKTIITNPNSNDTDWDKLVDGLEVFVYFSDPQKKDSDFDSVLDGDEALVYGTNPNFIDTDYDGLYDNLEIFVYHTNPNSPDTDGDTMPDLWEILNGLNPIEDDGFADADNDNLLNKDEYRFSTDPNNWDTDGDTLSDGIELLTYGTNPNEEDTDFDTLNDNEEINLYNTNPLKIDSDGDGFNDREEINSGTDPNNPRDNVFRRRLNRILLFTLLPLSIIIIFGVFLELRYRRKLKIMNKEEKPLLESLD